MHKNMYQHREMKHQVPKYLKHKNSFGNKALENLQVMRKAWLFV